MLGGSRARQIGDYLLVGAEQRRQLGTQGDARGARQRREVDDQVGPIAVGCAKRIAQHQPALGVRVADLDRQSLARRENVAGPVSVAADGVLDRRESARADPRANPRP